MAKAKGVGPYQNNKDKDGIRYVSDNGDSQGRGSTPDTKGPLSYAEAVDRNSGLSRALKPNGAK